MLVVELFDVGGAGGGTVAVDIELLAAGGASGGQIGKNIASLWPSKAMINPPANDRRARQFDCCRRYVLMAMRLPACDLYALLLIHLYSCCCCCMTKDKIGPTLIFDLNSRSLSHLR